jgi:hypothetical protein
MSVLFSSALINAQEGRYHHKGPGEKMRDLEKIKLIEALDMDEGTTLKFFSRRNAHKEKMEGFRKKEDEQIKKINELIEKTDDPDNQQMKKMIEEYFEINKEMNEEKRSFINSLDDILTYRQMAKLIVFEPRFREEIRKIIFEKRRPPR